MHLDILSCLGINHECDGHTDRTAFSKQHSLTTCDNDDNDKIFVTQET